MLTVAILRELGVPRIVARAFNERHGRVLLSIGANEVLDPEDEIGGRLALRLVRPSILDQLRFGEVRAGRGRGAGGVRRPVARRARAAQPASTSTCSPSSRGTEW